MTDDINVKAIMKRQRFLRMETLEVIAVTTGEGLGVGGDPYREVTFYMLKDGTQIGDNDPAKKADS